MKIRVLAHAIALTLLSVAVSTTARTEAIPLENEVKALRALGARGLQVFLDRYGAMLNLSQLPPANLRQALDSLCQQRDCHASRLYWYTDLNQAKAVAQASDKPILSLRLLGNLSEDLSCANSRFFRVALYPNAEISQFLRDHYILHWQSVRPVPKVTVDFGDGRTLERTLTGNSIHYILAASGQPLEAIPGLYGPQAFLRQLRQGEVLAKTYAQRPVQERVNYLQQYHRARLNATETRWTADLSRLGIATTSRLIASNANATNATTTTVQSPLADIAGRLAATKAMVENPMVSAVLSRNRLAQMTDETTWTRLASVYQSDAKLDVRSIALLQAKQATMPVSAQERQPKPSVFEAAMALDTVRNEYTLHSQIHDWFIRRAQTQAIDALNTKVYAELFLTPQSDPWLGLLPSNSYSAIDGEGIRQ
jgi:hypothetical protein